MTDQIEVRYGHFSADEREYVVTDPALNQLLDQRPLLRLLLASITPR